MASAPNKRMIPGWRTRALAGSAALVVLSAVAAACGNNETGPGHGPVLTTGAGGDAGDGGGGGGGGGDSPCPENATRDCHVSLGSHEGVSSCFEGEQTCTDGEWGPCVEAAPMPAPSPDDPTRGGPTRQVNPHILSLSTPIACNTNPCDPSCQTFKETPATPIGLPPQNLIAPWQTGNYGKLPTTTQSMASAEPCGQGQDCELDQYCSNPTSGTCTHSKCVTGAGLNSQCDPCVQTVCAADSTCCNTPITGCSHDLCVTGAALPAACNTCANTICSGAAPNLGKYAYCCATAWTAECVAKVTQSAASGGCGLTQCNSGTWSQSCVDKVATLCDATCLKDTVAPICAHDRCLTGGPLASNCDSCVTQVCAADAACCTTAWSGQCVQEVATICGQQCPTKGDCVPWLPSQTDPACAPWDLTVGVGCTDGSGVPQIPVCNHGSAQAPAGIPIVKLAPAASFPANRCAPSLSGGTTYTTATAIDPGKCINVAMSGIADGSLLVVNPQTAPTYKSGECHCDNNWSVYSSAVGACATPSCAGASAFAKLKKVKMFVTIDQSNSMQGTRWNQLLNALKTFAMDPASDDIGMWLRFWPYADPDPAIGSCPGANVSQCSPTAGCTKADKKLNAPKPADVPDLKTTNETIITDELTYMLGLMPNGGNTPMFPALEGALMAAQTFKAANPTYETVVLIVTDGDPVGCDTTIDDIAAVSGTYLNAYGIRTYAIGIVDPTLSQTTINKITASGGGKGFFVDPASMTPLATQITTAMGQIKQSFVSCTLALPNQAIFDPTKAALVYTPGAGGSKTIPQAANAGACSGDGWYYDNNAGPSSMTLCPTTCSAVKADVSGTLELKIDCISQYTPTTQKQVYAASCPKGTVPQWGYLSYDTLDPSTSNVKFSIHTSDVSNSFPAAPVLAATAQSTPTNTQKCAMGGPAPCPIDLYNALGKLPNARLPYLELIMDINPSADQKATPTLNNWQITYSCPDAE